MRTIRNVRTRRSSCAALLAVALGVVPHRALADDAKAEARRHIDAATALHQHRHWAEALDELNIAYTLDPQPPLLYAIAQLHVALGDCTQAITFYERFIASKPTPAREALARKAITICKTNPPPPEPGPESEVKPTRDVKPAPTPTPTPVKVTAPHEAPSSRPWYRDTMGDVMVGTAVVAGVASALLYRSALGDLDAANAAATYPEQTRDFADARRSRTYAVVAGAGGLVLLAAGIVRYVVHDRGTEPRLATAITLVPSGDGGIVSWSGGF